MCESKEIRAKGTHFCCHLKDGDEVADDRIIVVYARNRKYFVFVSNDDK